MPTGFVLTRLHARYTADALGEDLVFGRHSRSRGVASSCGQREAGARLRAGEREQLSGALCDKAPLDGAGGNARTRGEGGGEGRRGRRLKTRWDRKSLAATGLAFAPRGSVELGSFVKAGAALKCGFGGRGERARHDRRRNRGSAAAPHRGRSGRRGAAGDT